MELFDLSEVDDSLSYAQIPDGDYLAEILDAQVREFTGKNSAECKKLTVTFGIKDAEWAGQRVWHDLIFLHPASPRAQQIGRVQVKRLFLESGTEGADSDDLIGKMLVIRTRLETYTDRGGNQAKSVRVVDFYSAADDVAVEPVAVDVKKKESDTAAVGAKARDKDVPDWF